MTWTDEDLATLRRLAGEGKSARQIGEIMGRGRGGVCHQAAKHGIRLHGQWNLKRPMGV